MRTDLHPTLDTRHLRDTYMTTWTTHKVGDERLATHPDTRAQIPATSQTPGTT